MKSRPIGPGQNILASQNNDRRDDARGGGFLLPHQQLGVLALGTEPTNGQVVPIVINGTTIAATAVTTIGSTANNVLIGGSALAFVTNLVNFLRRPDLTTSTQVAASSANQSLLQYVGWAWPGSSTNIVPFSLNKNVNGLADIETSFNITGMTVTSGTWTAQTMELYIEDGTYYIGTTRVLFTGGSTPTFTAPASHPRIDIVTADSSGTIAVTTGTESVTPSAPTYPTNKVVICEVYHVVGETGIFDLENQQSGQGYIYNDVRVIVAPPYISSASQVASGLFILDPGSEVQGNVLYYNGSNWVLLAPGTSGFYLQTQGASANPQWAAFNVPEASGTDTGPTLTTATPTVTHTITHGLGKRPQFITATVSGMNAPIPSGSGSVTEAGYGWIFLDTNGNPQGGISMKINSASGVVNAITISSNSVSASGSSSGGTGTSSMTVQNVTNTTFDIVYSASVSAGSFSFAIGSMNWMVFG